jgi:hypothetical protein
MFNRWNAMTLEPLYGSAATSLSTFGGPIAFAAPQQIRLSINFEF